ncbi:MAG: hypothetical protein NTZ18_02405 [Candidatus Komeilibacteria bacterium]|nr:hypothetical protein [Candidatus Komeilibacteria bacterium]
MAKTIQEGQIQELKELLGAHLCKSRLSSSLVGEVLKHQGKDLIRDWETVLRRRVKAISKMFARRVIVDPKMSPQQMLDAIGRKQNIVSSAVASMPRGKSGEIIVHFFPLTFFDSYLRVERLDEEYRIRGLKPHPIAQGQVNIDDPTFADRYSNNCYWEDTHGNLCFEKFYLWGGVERHANVDLLNVWLGTQWFGGVYKS